MSSRCSDSFYLKNKIESSRGNAWHPALAFTNACTGTRNPPNRVVLKYFITLGVVVLKKKARKGSGTIRRCGLVGGSVSLWVLALRSPFLMLLRVFSLLPVACALKTQLQKTNRGRVIPSVYHGKDPILF